MVVEEEKAPRPDEVSDVWKEQEGWPKETGDMHLWGHHLGTEKVRRVRCDATQMRAARVCVCLPSPHLLTHLRPLSLSLSSLSLSLSLSLFNSQVDDPMLRDAARTQSEDEGTVSFTFSAGTRPARVVLGAQGGARPAYMNRPAVGNGGEAVAAAGAEGAKEGEAARDPKKGWLHLPAKRVEEAGGRAQMARRRRRRRRRAAVNTRTQVKMTSARTIQKREPQRGGGGREEGQGRVGRGALLLAALPRMGGRLAALLPTYLLSCPSLLPPCCSPPPRHRSDQAASTTPTPRRCAGPRQAQAD